MDQSAHPNKISSNNLLLVEGDHDKIIFSKLLEFLGLDDFQVVSANGKEAFSPLLRLIITDDRFNDLNAIGIIRDADNDFNGAFRSIQGAFRKASLTVPDRPLTFTESKPKNGIFIMPDNNTNGDLESLFLDSVVQEPVMECVDQYFDCLENLTGNEHPKPTKAKVQVYLASKPEGDLHLARAAQKDYWDWENEVFQNIKDFLLSMNP